MGEKIENVEVLVTLDNKTGNINIRGPQNTLLCYGILEMAMQSLREIRASALAAPVIPIAGKDIPFPPNGRAL